MYSEYSMQTYTQWKNNRIANREAGENPASFFVLRLNLCSLLFCRERYKKIQENIVENDYDFNGLAH